MLLNNVKQNKKIEGVVQLALRGDRCSIPGNIGGQMGWGSGQSFQLKMSLLIPEVLD